MNTVQNKDNAIRQMNDNNSGAFLQVREGCVVEGVGENVTGARPPLLGFGGDLYCSMTEASARGAHFTFRRHDGCGKG
jgi:hypothetical protein